MKTDKVIEGEAYPEHTAPRANGLLSVLHGLLMLKSLRFFRPLQGESRDLHPTEDKNWPFSMAGREDSGSAQYSAWNVTRVRGFGAWSIEDAVGNLQLETPSQSDEN
jgi:hypothetical protein